jgi:hypothetical protein
MDKPRQPNVGLEWDSSYIIEGDYMATSNCVRCHSQHLSSQYGELPLILG